ncbi:MAG: AI-2E family transporter [Thermaerobacter sp.]|nr:AI-2E family transporter [Bacillota bacterium]
MAVPRIDWTRVLIVCLALLSLAGVLALIGIVLGRFLQTLAVFALGAALAFVARPLVDRLSRLLRRRGLAVAVTAVGCLAATAAFLALVAGPLAADLRDVLEDLPRWQQRAVDALAGLRRWLQSRGIQFDEADLVRQAAGRLQAAVGSLLSSAAVITGRIGAVLAGALAAVVIALYLLLDGPRLRDRFYQALPEPWRRGVAHVERNAADVFGGYLRGQLLLGLIIGVTVGAGARLFGLPYPALVGLQAGLFELIPSVGALLGSILPLALALAQPFPTVLYVAVFLVVVAQLENHLLVPRITGQAVGLHPLAALLALLAGLEVAGLVGAFLAAPVTALAYRLFLDWQRGALAAPEPAGAPGGGEGEERDGGGDHAPGRGLLAALLEKLGGRAR